MPGLWSFRRPSYHRQTEAGTGRDKVLSDIERILDFHHALTYARMALTASPSLALSSSVALGFVTSS